MTNSVNSAKDLDSILFDISPKIKELAGLCEANTGIDKELFVKHDVKRGLRDVNGKGVLAGLTNISDVCAKKIVNGEEVPCAGNLYYRGYNIKDLVRGFLDADHFGYEEIAYLLLFGELPTVVQLDGFHETLTERRTLPPNFVRDVIMKAPSRDMMNNISRAILNLYSYDEKADDTSIPNVLRQCLNLISEFPMLMVYGYHAYNYRQGQDMYIYAPDPQKSTAENILMMLREDRQYTELEARILDMALVLHMDHGGGNNSTFTTHVVTSSGTDTYSTISAAMASLKGPKHGGANIKVVEMMDALKAEIGDVYDDEQVTAALRKVMNKELGDGSGLIYGMGHAVYTMSDPRAQILKENCVMLADAKGYSNDFHLLDAIERLSPALLGDKKGVRGSICANVDLYSGLVYRMLEIPPELYTPLFAVARMAGWCAHRIEESVTCRRIIRPGYKSLCGDKKIYTSISERKQ